MSKRTGKITEYLQAQRKAGLGSVRPFHALRQSALAAVRRREFFIVRKEVIGCEFVKTWRRK